MPENACPCGSDRNYDDCCQPFHLGEHWPDSVEALMRSRYSAFVLADAEYLLESWYPSTAPDDLDLSDNPEWVQLQILSAHSDGDHGQVHFRAFYREGKQLEYLEERSEFRRWQGRWLYLRGDIL